MSCGVMGLIFFRVFSLVFLSFFVFLGLSTFCRDLSDDRRYLPDNRRHLWMRLQANTLLFDIGWTLF